MFRNQAMDGVLEVLYRNPHDEFGVRQLRELTGHGGASVDTALELLEQLELIDTRWEGNSKRIGIDRARVWKPDDPIVRIPQEGSREPVAAFLDELRAVQGDSLVGVLLFGSVARGTADGASDVDVQVLVADDLLESRREIQTVRQQIEDRGSTAIDTSSRSWSSPSTLPSSTARSSSRSSPKRSRSTPVIDWRSSRK